MNYITLAIYAVILAVGGAVGYEVGAWHTSDLKAQIATIQAEEVKVKNTDALALADLHQENADMQAKVQQVLTVDQEQLTTATAEWTKQIADKDNKIASLQGNIKAGNQDLATLEAQLAAAKSPTDVALINQEISAKEQQIGNLTSQATGLSCLSAIIPDDLVGPIATIDAGP